MQRFCPGEDVGRRKRELLNLSKGSDFIWDRVWKSSSLSSPLKTMEILMVSNLEEAVVILIKIHNKLIIDQTRSLIERTKEKDS